ncbi:diacylglycerol kinase [Alkalibacillus flavidus]|uniref:Diacylglycerol kinase n=1 Tax=Alkalibacillus flavidus TaxID=546021 RepID=A0ABV2KS94_9BACI
MKRNRIGLNYALNGLKIALTQEYNFRIHLIVLVITVFAGLVVDLSRIEWLWIIIAGGFVVTLELINSVIEMITDVLFPDYDSIAKRIKDISAAAVLTSSITAMLIGIIIFVPKIWTSLI